jgi:co-chaperonin GroES (HSP10)
MAFRALHAVVAVKVDESQEFKRGIAIPVFAREELDTGTVVSAGPGEYDKNGRFKPNPVSTGDRVLIAKGAGFKVEVEGETLLMLTPSEITGILP